MSSTPEEDAAWRSIIENYGDEPAFPPAPAPEPDPGPEPVELLERGGHFVPPAPPPVPVPRGPRGLAWIGVLGVPLLTILLVVLQIHVPGWLAMFLLLWVAGGFVYLVATMRGPAEDGWDDGAVV